MDYVTFLDFFTIYLIGLSFGVIYLIFFCEKRSLTKLLFHLNPISFSFFILVFLLLFSSFYFFLSLDFLLYSGSLQTNGIFLIFMFLICFLSSLYFFGFINFQKNDFEQLIPQKGLTFLFKVSFKLCLNVHFIWLSLNAVLLSIFLYPNPLSIMLTFLGIYSSFVIAIINFRIS